MRLCFGLFTPLLMVLSHMGTYLHDWVGERHTGQIIHGNNTLVGTQKHKHTQTHTQTRKYVVHIS